MASVDGKRGEVFKTAVVAVLTDSMKGTGGLDRVGLASLWGAR